MSIPVWTQSNDHYFAYPHHKEQALSVNRKYLLYSYHAYILLMLNYKDEKTGRFKQNKNVEFWKTVLICLETLFTVFWPGSG